MHDHEVKTVDSKGSILLVLAGSEFISDGLFHLSVLLVESSFLRKEVPIVGDLLEDHVD